MKKSIFLILICLVTLTLGRAACYQICTEDGLSYTFITDDAGIEPATCTLNDPPGCTGGPSIYECPAIVGPVDEDATNIMLGFNPAKLRPCNAAEKKILEDALKGTVQIRYLDLKRIPQSTIDFLRTH